MAITIPIHLEVRDWKWHGQSASAHPFTDLTPYLALGGLKWSRNDIDAAKSGRETTQDGLMHRKRVSLKIRLDGTCRPLLTDEARIVLQAILPEWLEVRYLDPMYSSAANGVDQTTGLRTAQMYSNNIPATFLFMRNDGTSYWEGIEFPLVER